jgi:hypothetical protein
MTLELSTHLFKNLMHMSRQILLADFNMEIRMNQQKKKITFCSPELLTNRPIYILNLQHLEEERLAKLENPQDFKLEIISQDFYSILESLNIYLNSSTDKKILFKFDRRENLLQVFMDDVTMDLECNFKNRDKTLVLTNPILNCHIKMCRETYEIFSNCKCDFAKIEFSTSLIKFKPTMNGTVKNSQSLFQDFNDQEANANVENIRSLLDRVRPNRKRTNNTDDVHDYSFGCGVDCKIFDFLPKNKLASTTISKKKSPIVMEEVVYFFFKEKSFENVNIDSENLIKTARVWVYKLSNVNGKIAEEFYFETKPGDIEIGSSEMLIKEKIEGQMSKGYNDIGSKINDNIASNASHSNIGLPSNNLNKGNRNTNVIFGNKPQVIDLNNMSSFVANNSSQNIPMVNSNSIVIPPNSINRVNNNFNQNNASNNGYGFIPIIKEEYLEDGNNVTVKSDARIISRDLKSEDSNNNSSCVNLFSNKIIHNVTNNVNANPYSNLNMGNNIMSNIPMSNVNNASSVGGPNFANIQSRLNNVKIEANTSKGPNAWQKDSERGNNILNNNNNDLNNPFDERLEFYPNDLLKKNSNIPNNNNIPSNNTYSGYNNKIPSNFSSIKTEGPTLQSQGEINEFNTLLGLKNNNVTRESTTGATTAGATTNNINSFASFALAKKNAANSSNNNLGTVSVTNNVISNNVSNVNPFNPFAKNNIQSNNIGNNSAQTSNNLNNKEKDSDPQAQVNPFANKSFKNPFDSKK